jgi:hypothetical protein
MATRPFDLLLLSAAAVVACGRESSPGFQATELASPVPDSVFNPWLAGGPGGRPLLSWLAPLGGSRYALRFSTFGDGVWSTPSTVVEDDSIFIEATEIPSVRALDDRTLAAVWQRRTGGAGHGTYGIRVAFSADRGATWTRPLVPHRAPSEGGTFEFPTAYRTSRGELGLFWIDPRRQTVRHKPDKPEEMDHVGSRNLMWTTVSPDGRLGPEVEVDSVACDCCPMDVALSGDATVFAYRDKELPPGLPIDSLRYETTVVRDIAVARLEGGEGAAPAWHEGGIVHRDGWAYNGCPNNGPAAAAGGGRLAVAWWTAEGSRPRVQLAFSSDTGRAFGEPIQVSTGRPDGQVAVALVPDGAVVLWLENREVYARLVRPDGSAGEPVVLGGSGGRHRLPAPVVAPEGGLVITWLGPGNRLSSRRILAPSALANR